MKQFILLMTLLAGLVACSSNEKKVEKMTTTYDPVVEQDAQVARVIGMIQANENLDQDKKTELIELVNEQDKKITAMKKEQSQLRAVLIDQLLAGSTGDNTATLATSKQLEELNKKNIKGLNDFIIQFRSISGENDAKNNDYMREVGSVHFL